jgi:anti-sigma factor ChrR (cupin superfamily)
MRSAALDWQPSPSGSVWRKRLHLVGGAETGQVTSVVRYEPDSRFPPHDHPDGEEILVLAGVFSDEHGDWPAGSYILNPEGFRHAPFSREGCTIFVKLRQYGGDGREHVVVDTRAGAWLPLAGAVGVERQTLYEDPRFPEVMRLERWDAGARTREVGRRGGVEIFVIEGVLEDDDGRYEAGSWLRLPDGARHAPRSATGCLLYVKTGGVSSLRSAGSGRAGD